MNILINSICFMIFIIFPSISWGDSNITMNVKEFHMKYFGIPASHQEFIIIENDLNFDKKKDLLVTTREQCGSRGCEYSIYKTLGNKKYQFIGDVTGHLIPHYNSKFGFKELALSNKDTYLSSNKIVLYYYSPQTEMYKRGGYR